LLFEAADDDAVVVNELACTQPGCPPIETVVALLRAGSEPRRGGQPFYFPLTRAW